MSTAPLDLQQLLLNGADAHRSHADLLEAMSSNSMVQTITGASTFEVVIADAAWKFTQSALASQRSRLVLDSAGFTMVGVKRARGRVTLTFEDDAVAELRRKDSVRKAAANTTTRANFVRSLIAEVPDVKVRVAPGAPRALVELSRGSGGAPAGGGDFGIPASLPEYGTGVTPKTAAVAASPADVTPVKKEDTWSAAGRIMGEIGWRVYCYRGTVTIAPDGWLLRQAGSPYILTPDTSGVIDIDFDLDVGKPAATATVTAFAGFRDLAPGAAVQLAKVGAGNGTWLLQTIRRTTYSKQVTVELIKPKPTLPEPKGAESGNFGIPLYVPEYLGDQSIGSPGTGSEHGGGGAAGVVDRFVSIALAQEGKPYVYGTRGPNTFDCAGFTRWCAGQVGVDFPNPVSTQAAICRRNGTSLSVEQAIRTRGALLFREGGGGTHDHVVISLGNGNTIEAMGSAYGVRIGDASRSRGWTSAGYVPGIPVARAPSTKLRKPI